MKEYYKILGISPDASTDEIKKAYHNLAKQYHPDFGGNLDDMKLLNEAYEILSDKEKRKKYDDELNAYNNASKQNNSYQQASVVVHILKVDGSVMSKRIPISKLSNSDKQYFSVNNEVYAIENFGKHAELELQFVSRVEWDSHRMIRTKGYRPSKNIAYVKTISSGIRKLWSAFSMAIVVIIIIAGIVRCAVDNTPKKTSKQPVPIRSISTEKPRIIPTYIPTLPPEEPLPETGQILKTPTTQCIAPLEIKTQGSTNYYIYLKDLNNATENDISFFVRGGEAVEIDVPIGSYQIYYCSGTKWYGVKEKFGPNTVYTTSEELLEFTQDSQYVYGHTITLYKVEDGNFDTEAISASEFPE